MQLLISDANIIIDLEEGDLLDAFFSLPWQILIPDILYYEELEAQHHYLMEKGLRLGELTPETMLYAFDLIQRVRGPSRNDCFALALAKQQNCPLLTGDLALRKAAMAERVSVMGSVWVVEQLVELDIIHQQQAKLAYQRMRSAGRRLPWEEAFQRIEKLLPH